MTILPLFAYVKNITIDLNLAPWFTVFCLPSVPDSVLKVVFRSRVNAYRL